MTKNFRIPALYRYSLLAVYIAGIIVIYSQADWPMTARLLLIVVCYVLFLALAKIPKILNSRFKKD